MSAARNNYVKPGNLHGALLEILKLRTSEIETDFMNGFLAIGQTYAYNALLADIFPEQNINLLNGRSFKFESTASGILQQDEVHQAAVNSATGYSIVVKTIDCKSIDKAQMQS